MPNSSGSNRVFISCVSAEFQEGNAQFSGLRGELRKHLTRAGCEVKIQEELPQCVCDTLEKLDGYIRTCAAVVHLVGKLSGAPAEDRAVQRYLKSEPNFLVKEPILRQELGDFSNLTYTQWEAWIALHHNIPLFVYATNYATNTEAQKTHLERLKKLARRFAEGFSSQSELFGKLIGDLHKIIPLQPSRTVTAAIHPHPSPSQNCSQSDYPTRKQAGRCRIEDGESLMRGNKNLEDAFNCIVEALEILYGFLVRDLDAPGWPWPNLPEIEDFVQAAKDFRLLGDLLRKQRDVRALEAYQIAHDLVDSAGDSPLANSERGKLLSSLADAHLRLGSANAVLQKALEYGLKSIPLHENPCNKFELFQSLRILADVRIALRQYDQAEEDLAQAKQYWEDSGAAADAGRRKLIGWLYRTRGILWALQGRWADARNEFDRARALFQTNGDPLGLAIALAKLSAVDRQLGDNCRANVEFGKACEASRSISSFPDGESLQDSLRHVVCFGRIGVASSVSYNSGAFDQLDALEYAAEHGFAPVQLYLDDDLTADENLRKRVLACAQEHQLPLIVHAPGLLGSPESTETAPHNQAAIELLENEDRKRVVYHFDETRSVDDSFAATEKLCDMGIVPCIENYHRLEGPENARRNYSSYLKLLSRICERGLPAVAVIDIPRTFHERLGLSDEDAYKLTVEVLKRIAGMEYDVLLHLIDCSNRGMCRNDWCPVGSGAIPYTRIFQEVNGQVRFDDVVLECEDRHTPLLSREFLWKLTVPS